MANHAGVTPAQRLEGDTRLRDAHPLLQTKNLTKDHPGIRALDGMNFELKHGEVHVLFGENGAGKSTLISMIARANTPTAGEIHFNGQLVELGSVHGTILALTSVVGALVMASVYAAIPDAVWLAILLGCLAGVLAGTMIGVCNGVGVAFFGVSPFMMSLGTTSVGFLHRAFSYRRSTGLRHATILW